MKEIFKISSRFNSNKITNAKSLDDYIDVFEDKMKSWYLNWAIELNKTNNPKHQNQHAGFAVLLIGFWYFEAIQIFVTGEFYKKRNSKGKWVSKSGEFFKKSFKNVFSNELKEYSIDEKNTITRIAYDDGRCGLYHIGTTKSGIILDDGDNSKAIWIDKKDKDTKNVIFRIRINRFKFIETIETHFDKYIHELRNKTEYKKREKFSAAWEKVYGTKIPFSS